MNASRSPANSMRQASPAVTIEPNVSVLATLQETYGMAVAEALAHGLPIVATTTGAIRELVGEDAGLLVEPGDTTALTSALGRVIGDARRASQAHGRSRERSKPAPAQPGRRPDAWRTRWNGLTLMIETLARWLLAPRAVGELPARAPRL